ncbi:uncharacterized protein LOC104910884 isoform X3 [Meleagris gallopavo]|uniref:uncharacterized protein LOC104910884 isoform X3 n=1 Tax=Meleagris gallopavo TaxID=9103 RepID=UPI00093B0853|nr:uncharacterized protein LOC104910884 isoform X3 [Meleagris gallopavo]
MHALQLLLFIGAQRSQLSEPRLKYFDAQLQSLWGAQKIKQAIIHPDTNETIFMPFRMSGYIPFGTPIAAPCCLAADSHQLHAFPIIYLYHVCPGPAVHPAASSCCFLQHPQPCVSSREREDWEELTAFCSSWIRLWGHLCHLHVLQVTSQPWQAQGAGGQHLISLSSLIKTARA